MTLLPALGVALLAVLALHAGTARSEGVQAGPVHLTSPYNGSNGVTQLAFSDVGPNVTVSPVASGSSYGLFAGLGAVQELGQAGSVLAYGNFSSTGWTVINQSSAGQMAVVYSADMDVVHHGGAMNATPPQAGVVVAFSDPGGSGTELSLASNLTISISISNWPWLHPKDSLALVLPLGPSNASAEHLAGGGTDTMNCVASDSNVTKEYFSWSPNAVATDPSGDEIPVDPSTAIFGNGTNVALDVLIPGGTTGYVGLQYSVAISVVTDVPTAAVPLRETSAAVLAAVGVGIVAIVGVRRTWSRPNGLAEVVAEGP